VVAQQRRHPAAHSHRRTVASGGAQQLSEFERPNGAIVDLGADEALERYPLFVNVS
jgi:hypothetical protein